MDCELMGLWALRYLIFYNLNIIIYSPIFLQKNKNKNWEMKKWGEDKDFTSSPSLELGNLIKKKKTLSFL